MKLSMIKFVLTVAAAASLFVAPAAFAQDSSTVVISSQQSVTIGQLKLTPGKYMIEHFRDNTLLVRTADRRIVGVVLATSVSEFTGPKAAARIQDSEIRSIYFPEEEKTYYFYSAKLAKTALAAEAETGSK